MKNTLIKLTRQFKMSELKYFDIGVNFTDPMFQGSYNGKHYHPSDLEEVILRAKTFNVRKMLVTGSSLSESRTVLQLVDCFPNLLYGTVGVHPCHVTEIKNYESGEDSYLKELKALAITGRNTGLIKAFGEIGLDYDRLNYASKEDQLDYFEKQLKIAVEVNLPIFLHMRSANEDFLNILTKYWNDLPKGGVVHSFTGTLEELKKLLTLDNLFIGVNGCSLKTEENLQVVKEIPLEKLLIETDAPWCEIKKTHAGYKYLTPYPNDTYPAVITKQSSKLDLASLNKDPINMDPLLPFPLLKKEQYSKFDPTTLKLVGQFAAPLIKSRNEPVHIGQVVEIISNLKNVPSVEIAETTYNNGLKLFEIVELEETNDEYYGY